jgi:GAF domain-containing protein
MWHCLTDLRDIKAEGDGAVDPLAELNDKAFAALGAFLEGDLPLNQALDQLAHLACLAVPGCHMVGITLFDGETPTTAIHTHPEPPKIDQAQYDAGRGPCLDAMRLGQVNRIDDTAVDTRWPEFARAACDLGVRSTLGLPMRVGDRSVGGFNMYSSTPDAFVGEATDVAALFAAQAGLAVAGSLAYWHQRSLVQHLEEALKNRPVIEQAKGMIMARESVTADEAFDVLRRASQRENRKLRDIAVDIVRRALALAEPDSEAGAEGELEAG